MLRLALAGIALACSAASLFAGPPPPAEDPGNGPMRFEWRREGPADVCGSSCRVWISAVGYLTSDTAREFETFAAKARRSRGGVGARFRRRLGAGDDRARSRHPSARDGDDRGQDHAAAADRGGRSSRQADARMPAANPCAPSCCSRARAATCRRRRMCWCTRSGSARSARTRSTSSYSAEELNLVQRDIGRLAQYTIEMGGGIDLLETALRVPPWEPLYALSKEEIERMRLNTIATLFDQEPPTTSSIPPAATLATVGHPAPRRD